MGFDLIGRTALVTGGSRGIGKAIVLGMLACGANVAVIARGEKAIEQLERDAEHLRNSLCDTSCEPLRKPLREAGSNLIGCSGDVSIRADVERCVDHTVARFGRIDILVNNAGISIGSDILQLNEQDWWEDVEVNLGGPYYTCRAVAPIMVEQRSGSIVNISSQAARFGSKKPNYSASKAGVIGLTKSLARTLGPYNVRANAILPGVTDTDMIADWNESKRQAAAARIPLQRLGTPGEVAQVVLFLASDASSYVNGVAIDVCGGEPM